MLQQSDFFVKFLRIIVESVTTHHILSFQLILHLFLFEVLEKELFGMHDDFGRIIEEDTGRSIRQHVA
jgi:hypothetical protein